MRAAGESAAAIAFEQQPSLGRRRQAPGTSDIDGASGDGVVNHRTDLGIARHPPGRVHGYRGTAVQRTPTSRCIVRRDRISLVVLRTRGEQVGIDVYDDLVPVRTAHVDRRCGESRVHEIQQCVHGVDSPREA